MATFKLHSKSIIFAAVILTASSVCLSSYASTRIIPGDTDGEVHTNLSILKSTDENEVAVYLDDISNNIRLTACARLAEIGTSRSIVLLTNITDNQDEDKDLRDEASFALWMIRYRETAAEAREDLLLSLFSGDGDATKTARVKGWAMELLGDMGSPRAVAIFQTVTAYNGPGASSDYLKNTAGDNLKKTLFLTSFDPSVPRMTVIDAGLSHSDIVIRRWAVRALLLENPPDTIYRLNTLFSAASANKDYPFLGCLNDALKEARERIEDPIRFVYPQPDLTVKEPVITIIGYANEKLFTDTVVLSPGANTYTMAVRDSHGNERTSSVLFYFVSNPPVFNPVNDKYVEIGGTLNMNVSASDPDDAYLSYSAENLPEGASFDPHTQTLVWTPSAALSQRVRFTAYDSRGLMGQAEFNLTARPSWPLPSDVNRDGNVNLLDLIAVRSNLNKNPEDIPLAADVNKDGRINILDLIETRSHLRERVQQPLS